MITPILNSSRYNSFGCLSSLGLGWEVNVAKKFDKKSVWSFETYLQSLVFLESNKNVPDLENPKTLISSLSD